MKTTKANNCWEISHPKPNGHGFCCIPGILFCSTIMAALLPASKDLLSCIKEAMLLGFQILEELEEVEIGYL